MFPFLFWLGLSRGTGGHRDEIMPNWSDILDCCFYICLLHILRLFLFDGSSLLVRRQIVAVLNICIRRCAHSAFFAGEVRVGRICQPSSTCAATRLFVARGLRRGRNK